MTDKKANDFKLHMSEQAFEYKLDDMYLRITKEILADWAIDDVNKNTINELFINNNPMKLDHKDSERLSFALTDMSKNTPDWYAKNQLILIEGALSVKKTQHENAYWDANFNTFVSPKDA
jgi:hypothetical protein